MFSLQWEAHFITNLMNSSGCPASPKSYNLYSQGIGILNPESEAGFRIQDSRILNPRRDSGFRIPESEAGFRIQDSGFLNPESEAGFRIQDS